MTIRNDSTARTPEIRSPRCAVVVSSRNRAEKICACVESGLASNEANFEMVFVDQSDNDETERAIQRYLADRDYGTCAPISEARVAGGIWASR